MELELAALGVGGELLELVGVGGVDLGGDDDHRLLGEGRGRKLASSLLMTLKSSTGSGRPRGIGHIDQVDQQAGALDVAQKLDAEAVAEVRAFDEAGHVGDDEGFAGRAPRRR